MGDERQLLARAKELFAQDKLEQSEAVFKQLTGSMSLAGEGISGIGMIRLRQGDIAKAISLFNTALELNASNADAHYGLGVAAERCGEFENARSHYKKALSFNEHHAGASKQLKYVTTELGKRFGPAANRVGNHDATVAAEPPIGPIVQTHVRQEAKASQITTPHGARRVAPNSSVADDEAEGLLTAGDLVIEGRRRMRSFSFAFVIASAVTIVGLFMSLLSHPSPDLAVFSKIVLALALLLWAIIFVRSRCTHYSVYEGRIDIKEHVLSRKEQSVWIYELKDPELRRSFFNLITGDAVIYLHPYPEKIRGLGSYKRMRELWQALRDDSIKVRRKIKKIWI